MISLAQKSYIFSFSIRINVTNINNKLNEHSRFIFMHCLCGLIATFSPSYTLFNRVASGRRIGPVHTERLSLF